MKTKYIRMITKMKNDGAKDWCVYILRCGDGSLYTGTTKNIEERIRKHNRGQGAAYTRTHLPVRLVYHEAALSRSEALVREAAVKRLPKAKKEALIHE